MCVVGVVMALREDVGLSWLLLVCVPALVIAIGLIVSRMVPQFRLMQDRIDNVNRVLREQLSGIGWSGRSSGSPPRPAGSPTPTPRSPTPRCGSAGCRR